MKRVAVSSCGSPSTSAKASKLSEPGETRTARIMAESGGTGLPMNVDPDNGGRTDAVAPEDQNVQYNVPTNNRFAILPIPIPGASTLRTPSTPKVRKPPAFHVFEPVNSIRSRLPASMNIVIQNQRNCVNVWPNTIAQHKLLYDQFKQWNWNFHTQSPEPLSLKKFVLHDLNTYPVEDIYDDLEAYGLRPALITTIPVKRPRYPDQAVYIVHYEKTSNVTLDVIRQAKYIQRTVARWDHFIQNGDGISICSRCSYPGHSATFCNRPIKCKVCSEPHLTNECPLILAKRNAKMTEISPDLLKCPLCNGKHTAGYRACAGRQAYKNNRATRQRTLNYTNAPLPQVNPWINNNNQQRPQPTHPNIHRGPGTFPPLPTQRNNQMQASSSNTAPAQPIFNSPQYNNNINSNQFTHNQSDRFSTDELFNIFYKMIDVVEKCNNKADQLRALGQIVSEHLCK